MNSASNDQKRFSGRSLAKSLSALFALGGGLVLGSASSANTLSAEKDGVKELEIRVEKIQKQLGQTPGTGVSQGDVPSKNMHTVSWVNWVNWWHKWHNWHNWHPGWGNGWWHKWHNWHNW